jgi:hypothetical protein
MLPVRSFAVGQLEPPCVRQRNDSLQPLYLGDGLLDVHAVSISEAIQPHLVFMAVANAVPAATKIKRAQP